MCEEWIHKIKVLDFSCKDGPKKRLFSCVAGVGSCSPEDVGGETGYKCFCASINDPQSDEYERNREWVYKECLYPETTTWPNGFDFEKANKELEDHESWYKKLVRQRKKVASRW